MPYFSLVDVEVDGFPTVRFQLQNMVMDTSRFEQYPGFNTASDSANGKPYCVIPGLDIVHRDRPVMLFNEKRICTTVYLPAEEVMNSCHSTLLQEINGILYGIYCDGKLQMTNAAKMSSGPIDIKLYYASNKSDSKRYLLCLVNVANLFLTVAELIQKRIKAGIPNPSANIVKINSTGTGVHIPTPNQHAHFVHTHSMTLPTVADCTGGARTC